MFSVETTYYCASCRKVKVKDWQYDNGIDARVKYFTLMEAYSQKEDVLTMNMVLRWIDDNDDSQNPMSSTLLYYQKSIDTSVNGIDGNVFVSEKVNNVYNDMNCVKMKEVA